MINSDVICTFTMINSNVIFQVLDQRFPYTQGNFQNHNKFGGFVRSSWSFQNQYTCFQLRRESFGFVIIISNQTTYKLLISRQICHHITFLYLIVHLKWNSRHSIFFLISGIQYMQKLSTVVYTRYYSSHCSSGLLPT